MARAPSYTMGKQRNSPAPYPSGSKRPSAFDRFPSKARNEWINEMRAKIDGTLNPPSPPGPSRSPSPLEEDEIPLGVAQSSDDLGLSEGAEDELDEDEGYVSGEQEEYGSYDEEDEDEDDDPEDQNSARPGSQIHDQEIEEDSYEDEEDEGIEDDEEEEGHDSRQPQLRRPQYLEDEVLSTSDIDPRLIVDQLEAEGEYDEDSEDPEDQGLEEEDELEGDERPEDGLDAEKENSITYIGDTDEEEGVDSEDEEEDAGEEDQYTEEEEDVEDEEIDDDGMGGLDPLPLEEQGMSGQFAYDTAAPAGVEHGPVVYDYRTSNAELEYLRDTHAELESEPAAYSDFATGFINPNQLPDSGPEASGSAALYPPIPAFDTTPAFIPASQLIPPWEPSPLDPAALAAEAMDTDLIDPSLLADFAQRVEAQASGDLGNTTDAQNTTEMNALAGAVMDQYNDTPEQMLGTKAPPLEVVEEVQHGMGEAEGDGYEEDHESRATSEDAVIRDQSEASEPRSNEDEQILSGDEEEDGSEEDSDSQEESPSATSPGFTNTQNEPIEILSSDEEDAQSQGADEDDQDDERDQDDEQQEEEDEDEDEDEEEEQVEPARPVGQHTRFDLDMKDVLTPPRTASRSSGRTPVPSLPVSPTIRLGEPADAPEENMVDVEETEEQEGIPEEDSGIEQPLEGGYPFSPMAIIDSEPEIQSAAGVDPIEPLPPANPVITVAEEVIIEINDELAAQSGADEPYQVEVEEPVSRGPSVPLVTPAVELPMDAAFPTIPEAGLEAIMRALVQPDVIEETAEDSEVMDESAGTEVVEHLDIEVTELEPEPVANQENVAAASSETASPESSEDQMKDEIEEVTPSPIAQPPSPMPVSATDFATLETDSQLLPDPHVEPIETDLAMPDVPFHRSRTPSLIVEPPANPPNPDIVVDRPTDEPPAGSEEDLPDPQDPVPDTHIVAPLLPHDMRPTLERSPSLFVNIQEVEMMLDPGPNETREESPVDFPEHDQPAPPTDLDAPIEPEDLEPRDEPRSVSMEAMAPGQAPLEEVTGAVEQEETDGVDFPEPGEAAPNTYIPSPLDVRRDLPLDVEGSEVAPSLVVEPPSEPATGPSSPTAPDAEVSDFLDVPEIAVDEQEGEDDDVPTSSSIDVPSAPLRATTPTAKVAPSPSRSAMPPGEAEAGPSITPGATFPNEAGRSETQHIRFTSPLRHHHGHVPRHTSVPPPTTRVTRRHTRQSSAAIDALTPPVTRQNCHYRKLYMVEGDMSAVVLVPQCALTDHDNLQEENSEDRGDATPADEADARHQPICEATPRLQLILTAKLHRIVGSDIFDEAQKTYLLQASDEALLPHVEEASGSTSTSGPSTSTPHTKVSPLKSRRRSKRLSEAPSETSTITEEPSKPATTKHKRSVSIAQTASPVPEADEAEADAEGRYELRSKSEAPALDEEDEETATVTGSEIEAVEETDDAEVHNEDEPTSATASPSTAQPTSSKRYSLRSQPEIQVDDEDAINEDRAATPNADEPTVSQSQATPMTTRRRARESVSTAPQSSAKGSNTQVDKDETEIQAESATPRGKGKSKSKSTSRSPKKGKREPDSKYVYSGDEDEDDNDEGEEDVKIEDEEEVVTERESSAEIIPYKSQGTPSSGTGRKKRKLGSSVGHNSSPWQLGVQDVESDGTPSRKSKKRAVESKDEPDVPVPVEVGDDVGEKDGETEEEVAPLPQPKGWMSYIWPFKR